MCTESGKYAVRQFFILTTGCIVTFSIGIMVTFPAVLNPSIQSSNSTIQVTSDQASWIAASNGIAGIFGLFLFSPLFQYIGRKYGIFIESIILVIGWVIFFFAKNMYHLLFARIVQGIIVGAYYIVAVTYFEYCDPKRRGYFMSMKKIAQGLGALACHSLVLVMNWRQIAGVAAIPVVLSAVMILFWPESPAFLALKGKFSECEKSFIWLNGTSIPKLKELNDLINAQTERLQKKKAKPFKSLFIKQIRKILRKDFLKPFLIVSLLTLAIDASGRYFLLIYVTQIIVEITENKSVAMYCAITSDFLVIFALFISCFVIKSFKRRTILFTLGAFANFLMFTISLALVLKNHFDLAKDIRWLIPSIVLMHSFVSHVGLIPTAFAISAELFPLEHKGLGSIACGIVITSLYASSVKLTPLMIESTGVAGTYAINGIFVTVCLIVLYIILPETKDKTLQEIEDEVKGVQRTQESDVFIHYANNI